MKTKSKKFLIVSSKFPPFEYSGSGLRAYKTYLRLKKKYGLKWDAVVSSTLLQGNKYYFLDNNLIYRIAFPFKKKSNFFLKYPLIIAEILWQTIFSIFFLIKNEKKYKLLHTFGDSWSIGIFTLYFFFKNKPVIREVVNDVQDPFYPKQINFLIKKVFINKNLIVAISKKLKILCKKHKVKNIWQRCNPVDENKFYIDYKNKFKLRYQLTNFSKKDIILCYVASLVSRKNQIFILEALKFLPLQYKLVIAGPINNSEPNYKFEVINKIKELKLEKRVLFKVKFIKNIDQYMKLSDVYLIPSLSEGFGTTVLEAQACGVPVVSNLLKNITDDYIINGKGGYSVTLNIEKFAKKIKLASRISKKNLTINAKMIKSKYSTQVIDAEYYNRISKIL